MQETEAARFGVYPAEIFNITDPENTGRVPVRLPWAAKSEGEHPARWARMAVLMAGHDRVTWFMPDIGDEVLVCFEEGNPQRAPDHT